MPRSRKTRTRFTDQPEPRHIRKMKQARLEVAAEAARIIATEGQHNYHAAKKKAAPKAAAKAAAPSSSTMLDNILGMINRSRTGITVERLKKRTGLAPRQVSNALYKLTKKGSIKSMSRGIYTKA